MRGGVDKWHQSETAAWLRSAETGDKVCVFKRKGKWFACVGPYRGAGLYVQAWVSGPFPTRDHAACGAVYKWEVLHASVEISEGLLVPDSATSPRDAIATVERTLEGWSE